MRGSWIDLAYTTPVLDCDRAATPARVWDVLADGWSLPSWVVGASRIRAVEPGRPAVGTCLHHSVGLWPLLLDDVTRVEKSVPEQELVLHARAWPFGVAEVAIRIDTDGDGSTVELLEHAVTAPTRWIPDRIQETAVLPRNRECLRGLVLIAESATGARTGRP
ncbi:SRPBCC family protein [Rhodococcus sp. NPDC003318]|uniref:SRPBCC family protein n=1 Tax=Rhodococcus sp. NPDC003318 TaxID=3364503 RepID=UPI0036B9DFD1